MRETIVVLVTKPLCYASVIHPHEGTTDLGKGLGGLHLLTGFPEYYPCGLQAVSVHRGLLNSEHSFKL